MAPNQGWSLPKAKTRHFAILDFGGGGGGGGTNFPSILSKILAREARGRETGQTIAGKGPSY